MRDASEIRESCARKIERVEVSDSNRSTTLVIVIVSRRAISDAIAAIMVDSPIGLWGLA